MPRSDSRIAGMYYGAAALIGAYVAYRMNVDPAKGVIAGLACGVLLGLLAALALLAWAKLRAGPSTSPEPARAPLSGVVPNTDPPPVVGGREGLGPSAAPVPNKFEQYIAEIELLKGQLKLAKAEAEQGANARRTLRFVNGQLPKGFCELLAERREGRSLSEGERLELIAEVATAELACRAQRDHEATVEQRARGFLEALHRGEDPPVSAVLSEPEVFNRLAEELSRKVGDGGPPPEVCHEWRHQDGAPRAICNYCAQDWQEGWEREYCEHHARVTQERPGLRGRLRR